MTSTLNQAILISMLVFSSALAGCTQENEALTDDEIGELSVVVTLDFLGEGNQTTNLADRLSNGSITFDPVLVAENVSAYRVMEALQVRENFTIDVTYYVGLGAFIHTIDGVSGAEDGSTYWGFYQDGVMAEVGVSTLLITSDTNLSWVITPV